MIAVQTIRLWRSTSVAHLATHDTTKGWHSRCTQLWYGSEWIGHDREAGPVLVTLPESHNGRCGGRPLHLEDLRDLPVHVRVCTYCVLRHRWDAAQLTMALAARGAL